MIKRISTLSFLLFVSLSVLAAGPGDDIAKKAVKASELSAADQARAIGFTKAIKANLKNQEVFIKPDFMLDLKEAVSEAAADDRSTASRLMAYLDNNPGQLREDLEWNDLTVLPVGLKKRLSDNSSITLGILSAQFYPTHADLTVFVRLITPVNSENSSVKERELFFGIEGITLTRQGGMADMGFKAVLLGDYLLPFKDWTVNLKGGIDKSIIPTTDDPNRTYVEFDCGEFKELNIAADVIVPRSKLVPCEETGEVIENESERVKATGLRVTTTNGLRDIVFNTGVFNHPFALPKHPEYAFKVQNFAFDISDYQNPTSLVFPRGYVGDMDSRWQGLSVGTFEIIMPEEFLDKDTGERVKIGASEVLWDRTGFSGFVYAHNINKGVNAKKWRLTLDNLEVGFLQGKFQSGYFDGGVETPVHQSNAPDEELFSYAASIYLDRPAATDTKAIAAGIDRSNYSLVVTTGRNIPMNFFYAKADIYEGSQVILDLEHSQVAGYKFKPSAVLSGELSIGASTDEDENSAVSSYQEDKGIDFGGIEFNRLVLQTESPYFSIKEFKYNAGENNLFVNFPAKVTKFQKRQSSVPEGEIWTDVGINLSLFKDKISGAGDFTVISFYDVGTAKLSARRIKVNDVRIKGRLPAINFDGYVSVTETDEYKEISGGLAVQVTKPTPFEAGINVLFGRNKVDNFKYGFVDGYVVLDGNGIPMGPVNLYGAGLGVYWNMQPSLAGISPCENPRFIDDNGPHLLEYCASRDVPFGLRMMAAIKNPGDQVASAASGGSSAFKARVYLDIGISAQFGINHIAVFGNGVIAGNFLDDDTPDAQIGFVKNIMKRVTPGGSNNVLASQNKMKNLNTQINGNESPNADLEEPSSKIAFTAGIMLDIPKKLFHLEAEVFMSSAGLTGIGNHGRVGKVAIHFDPDQWYINLGRSPKNERIGIKYGELARIDAYLMIGNQVPPFPSPDPEVLAFFPGISANYPPGDEFADGTAFALGASARLNIYGGGKRWYAQGLAIAGLDLLVANNDPAGCRGVGEWYGKGQLYAIASIDAGFQNKKQTKQFKLLTLGVGIYAFIEAPDPFYLDAQVCFKVPKWIKKDQSACLALGLGQQCEQGS